MSLEKFRALVVGGNRWPNYGVSNLGYVWSNKSKAALKNHPTRCGYKIVSLCFEGVSKHIAVHRLVAAAFLGPIPPRLQVNHIDGNKANNEARNLEYVTASENMEHSYRIGLHPRTYGADAPNAKLSWDQVREIRRIGSTMKQRDLAKKFGTTQANIFDILKYNSWKD